MRMVWSDKPETTQAPGPVALPTYFGFTFDKKANLLVAANFFGTAHKASPQGGQGAVSSFR